MSTVPPCLGLSWEIGTHSKTHTRPPPSYLLLGIPRPAHHGATLTPLLSNAYSRPPPSQVVWAGKGGERGSGGDTMVGER